MSTYIALHARTAEQHYAGDARWDAIAELKAHVRRSRCSATATSGRRSDAVAMMRATGCDGVVIGRGCLGRPWLFGDLLDRARTASAPPPSRSLGVVIDVMADHARALVDAPRQRADRDA